MTDHDPLCPVVQKPNNPTLICECYFIGKARTDEREKIAQAIEAAAELHYAPSAVKRAARIARNRGSDE